MEKPTERFLEITSVISRSAKYYNTEYLTFFHDQKSLFIRCELYKDAAGKACRQYKHDFTYRDKIDD